MPALIVLARIHWLHENVSPLSSSPPPQNRSLLLLLKIVHRKLGEAGLYPIWHPGSRTIFSLILRDNQLLAPLILLSPCCRSIHGEKTTLHECYPRGHWNVIFPLWTCVSPLSPPPPSLEGTRFTCLFCSPVEEWAFLVQPLAGRLHAGKVDPKVANILGN